jgi:hypothetical protein
VLFTFVALSLSHVVHARYTSYIPLLCDQQNERKRKKTKKNAITYLIREYTNYISPAQRTATTERQKWLALSEWHVAIFSIPIIYRDPSDKPGERKKVCLIYRLSVLLLWHRHLLRLTSTLMKSETKGCNTWEKPCEQTPWARKSLLDLSSLLTSCLTQTLTTLNLHKNQIEDKGAQYLAEALQTNMVSEKDYASSIFSSRLLSNTGTCYTLPLRKSNRRERGAISPWTVANKHGEW